MPVLVSSATLYDADSMTSSSFSTNWYELTLINGWNECAMRRLWWAYGFLHSKDHIDMSRAQLSAIRSDHTTQPLNCSPILVCPFFVCKSIMESIKMSSAFDSNESSLKFQRISSDDKLQLWFHLVVLISVGTYVCVCVSIE